MKRIFSALVEVRLVADDLSIAATRALEMVARMDPSGAALQIETKNVHDCGPLPDSVSVVSGQGVRRE